MARSFITGWGLCTPLGASADQTFSAIQSGKYITTHSRASLPQDDRPRVDQLASHVVREATAQAGWSPDQVGDVQTAWVIATSKGPIEQWIDPITPPAGEFGLHQVATSLGRTFSARGPSVTYSAACASGLHALLRAEMFLHGPGIRRCVVVAVESSLHPIFVSSFGRLGVLARDRCRPFDEDRDGFLMSEAAAAVCVEPAVCGHATEIESVQIAADATHLTGSDPEARSLRRLIRRSVAGSPVDLVHAHGTGTAMNDAIELAAINSELTPIKPGPGPIVFSHKGSLGHSLGAAGLVAAVLNCMMHQRSATLPMPATGWPLPSSPSRLAVAGENLPIRRSIVLASGFGGTLGAATLKTVEIA